jgi:uncharacterized membrane protein
MSDWTKVVTDPLGLAGFALFLVFGFLAKLKRRDLRRWLAPLAMIMAVIALVGGLSLAYVQVRRSAQPVPVQTKSPAAPSQPTSIQVTTGQGSPTVNGVNGDVNITVDQSSGKTETQKVQQNKPQEKKTQ